MVEEKSGKRVAKDLDRSLPPKRTKNLTGAIYKHSPLLLFCLGGWEGQSKCTVSAFIHCWWPLELPLLSDRNCVQILQLHIKWIHVLQQSHQANSFFFPQRICCLECFLKFTSSLLLLKNKQEGLSALFSGDRGVREVGCYNPMGLMHCDGQKNRL